MTARITLFTVLALLMGACTSGGEGELIVVGDTVLTHFEPGKRTLAEPVEGESLRQGPRIERGLLSGKVGVVHFWGSWCGPCRREEPIFVKISKRYRTRGVRFLGVDSRRDQRAEALAFWDEFGVEYPSVYDPSSRIAFLWGVIGMPQTFVVDKQGKIAATFHGAVDDEQALEKVIDEELAR